MGITNEEWQRRRNAEKQKAWRERRQNQIKSLQAEVARLQDEVARLQDENECLGGPLPCDEFKVPPRKPRIVDNNYLDDFLGAMHDAVAMLGAIKPAMEGLLRALPTAREVERVRDFGLRTAWKKSAASLDYAKISTLRDGFQNELEVMDECINALSGCIDRVEDARFTIRLSCRTRYLSAAEC